MMDDRLFELARSAARQVPEAEGKPSRLGAYLKLLRADSGKTLRQVAEEANGQGDAVSVSLLADAEKGKVVPSAAKLITLAKIYRVPAQRFLDLIELDSRPLVVEGEALLDALEAKAQEMFQSGDYARAHACLERALEFPMDEQHRILVRNRKAVCLWKMGKLHWARDEFESVLGIFDVSPVFKMQAYGNLSAVFQEMSNFEMSRAMALQALQIAQESDDRDRQGIILNTLGNLDYALYERRNRRDAALIERAAGHFHEALGCFDVAASDTERASHRIVVLMNLGNCEILRGKSKDGFRRLREAFKASEDIHHYRYTAQALNNLGKGHYETDDFEPAKGFFHKSELMAVQHGYNDIRFSNHYYLWKIAVRENNQVSERGAFKTLQYLLKHCEGNSTEVVKFLEYLQQKEKQS